MTKLDDLLQKWPMRQTSQLEADEAGDRFVSAVQSGQMPAEIDTSLLHAPLPKAAEEGNISKPGAVSPGASVESKMSKDRTRDRTSFQELAKLATTPPPASASQSGPHVPPPSVSNSGVERGAEASSSDSGIVDLKMIATADPAGAQRAQTTPLAAEGLFDDDAAPAKSAAAPAPAPAKAESAPAAAPAVAQADAAPKAVKAPPAEKKGGGGVVVVLGSLVTAAAIAAGVFFYVKSRHASSPVAAVTKVAEDNQKGAAVGKPATNATTTAAVSVAQADTADITNDTTVTQGSGKPSFRFHAKAGGGGATTGGAAPDTAASGAVDPKLIANIPTGPAGGNGGDLNEAMKVAAGGGAGTGTGAGGANQGGGNATGNVPQRPSQGQVTGAIGNVMPAARACLASDEPVSHATVILQSDGTVKSISVSGFAAGKPQEACIKGALQKMTVNPFAEATYPVTVTIRPQ